MPQTPQPLIRQFFKSGLSAQDYIEAMLEWHVREGMDAPDEEDLRRRYTEEHTEWAKYATPTSKEQPQQQRKVIRPASEQENFFDIGMRAGYTRQQLTDWAKERGLTKWSQARVQFMEEELPGWKPTLGESPARWRMLGGYGRTLRLIQERRSVGGEFYDEEGKPRIPKPGEYYDAPSLGKFIPESRSKGAFQYDLGTAIQATMMPATTEGKTIVMGEKVAAATEKLAKSEQRWGRHETVLMSGLQEGKTYQGFLKPGPGSLSRERYQSITAALIVGGDPYGAGQLRHNIPGEVRVPTSRTIYSPTPLDPSLFKETGTAWGAGKRADWATGFVGPISRTFAHRLTDVASFQVQEGKHKGQYAYRATFERFIPTNKATIAWKEGPKTQGPYDPWGPGEGLESGREFQLATPMGRAELVAPLALLDVYQRGSEDERKAIRDRFGLGDKQALNQASLRGLGQPIMDWFWNDYVKNTKNVKDYLIESPIVHKDQLKYFEKVEIGREDLGDNLFRLKVRYPVIVTPMAFRPMYEYNFNRVRLPQDEAQDLKKSAPDTWTRLYRQGRYRQQSYQDLIQAQYATETGNYPLNIWEMQKGKPVEQYSTNADVVSANSPAFKEFLFNTMLLAEQNARETLKIPQGEAMPVGVLARHFWKLYSSHTLPQGVYGGKNKLFRNPFASAFVKLGDGPNAMVLQPASTGVFWQATGMRVGDEVSPYAMRAFEAFQAIVQGSADELGYAIEGRVIKDKSGRQRRIKGLAEIQEALAYSKKAVSYATSIFGDKPGAVGELARYHPALAADEIYIPGVPEGVSLISRAPTMSSWLQVQGINIGDAKAAVRGIRYAAVSSQIQEAIGGDFDGDKIRKILKGELTVDEHGAVRDLNGEKVDIIGPLKKARNKAIRYGANEMFVRDQPQGGDINAIADMLAVQAAQGAKGDFPQSNEQIEQLMRERFETGKTIGPVYNLWKKALSVGQQLGQAETAVAKALWDIGYQRAQQKKPQEPAMESMRNLAVGLLGYGSNISTRSTRLGGYGTVSDLGGLLGLRHAVIQSMFSMVTGTEGNEARLDPEQMAIANFPKEERAKALDVINKYAGRLKKGENPKLIRSSLYAELTNLGNPVEGWTNSLMGTLFGGMIVSRTIAKGKSPLSLGDISRETVHRLRESAYRVELGHRMRQKGVGPEIAEIQNVLGEEPIMPFSKVPLPEFHSGGRTDRERPIMAEQGEVVVPKELVPDLGNHLERMQGRLAKWWQAKVGSEPESKEMGAGYWLESARKAPSPLKRRIMEEWVDKVRGPWHGYALEKDPVSGYMVPGYVDPSHPLYRLGEAYRSESAQQLRTGIRNIWEGTPRLGGPRAIRSPEEAERYLHRQFNLDEYPTAKVGVANLEKHVSARVDTSTAYVITAPAFYDQRLWNKEFHPRGRMEFGRLQRSILRHEMGHVYEDLAPGGGPQPEAGWHLREVGATALIGQFGHSEDKPYDLSREAFADLFANATSPQPQKERQRDKRVLEAEKEEQGKLLYETGKTIAAGARLEGFLKPRSRLVPWHSGGLRAGSGKEFPILAEEGEVVIPKDLARNFSQMMSWWQSKIGMPGGQSTPGGLRSFQFGGEVVEDDPIPPLGTPERLEWHKRKAKGTTEAEAAAVAGAGIPPLAVQQPTQSTTRQSRKDKRQHPQSLADVRAATEAVMGGQPVAATEVSAKAAPQGDPFHEAMDATLAQQASRAPRGIQSALDVARIEARSTPEQNRAAYERTQQRISVQFGQQGRTASVVSPGLIRHAEELAEHLKGWDKSVFDAMRSTEKLNKDQIALSSTLKDAEKTFNQLEKGYREMASGVPAPGQEGFWKTRKEAAQSAMLGLGGAPGYAPGITALEARRDLEFQARQQRMNAGLPPPEDGGGGGGRGGWGGGGGGGMLGGRGLWGLGDLGWTMFNVQRVWRWTGGALSNWTQQYAQEQMIRQGIDYNVGGGGQLAGVPQDVLVRRAQQAYMTSQLGEAAGRTFGPALGRITQTITNAPEGQQDAIVRAMGYGGVGLAASFLGGWGMHKLTGLANIGGNLGAALLNKVAIGGAAALPAIVGPQLVGAGAATAARTGMQYLGVGAALQTASGLGGVPVTGPLLEAAGGANLTPPQQLGAALALGGLPIIGPALANMGAGQLWGKLPIVQQAIGLGGRGFQAGANLLAGIPGPVGTFLGGAAQALGTGLNKATEAMYGVRTTGQPVNAPPQPLGPGGVATAPTNWVSANETNVDKIVRAMADQGYTPEETYSLINSLTYAGGRPVNYRQVQSAANTARLAGTTPAGLVSQIQSVAGLFGAMPGTKGFGVIQEQYLKSTNAPYMQMQQQAVGQLLQPQIQAGISQGMLTPESAFAVTQQSLAPMYGALAPQMQLAAPSMNQLFATRGMTAPIQSLMLTVPKSQGGMGYTQAQANFLGGWAGTQAGWAAGQFAAAGGGQRYYVPGQGMVGAGMNAFGGKGWDYGGYEWSPNYGTQVTGFTANLEQQERFGYARAGMNIASAAGNLELHKAFTVLTKELRANTDAQIQANRAYQMQEAGFAAERATLSYQQGMESIGLAERTWQVQRAYQVQEMAIQQKQYAVQTGWKREDFSYQSSMAGMQYGWQQEDIGRAIRFSTGQQRQQLLRQQERGQITYAMETGQRGRERGRFETQVDWQEAGFERQKKYQNELAALQQEQFNMQREHLTENYELTMRQITAQTSHMQAMWGLEDAERKLQRDYQDKQLKFQEDEAKRQLASAKMSLEEFKLQIDRQKKIAENEKLYEDAVKAAYQSPDGTLYGPTMSYLNAINKWFKEAAEAWGAPPAAEKPPTSGEQEEGGNILEDKKKPEPKPKDPTIKEPGDDPPEFQLGGIVTRPTRALIGEAGPEAIIPLSKMLSLTQDNKQQQQSVVLHVYLGDQDITSLVTTKVVQSALFESGINDMARRQRNRYGLQ